MVSKPVTKAPARVSGFRLDATGVFDDPKKEAFCKALAKTGLLKDANTAAGIAPATGTKWRGHAEIERRIRALRAGGETYIGVSESYVISQLRLNAENAATNGKYRESNDALIAIHKIITRPKSDTSGGANSGLGETDFASMTPQQLAEARLKMFPNPRLPADTRMVVEDLELDEDGMYVKTEDAGPVTAEHVEPAMMLTVKFNELAKPFEDPEDEAAEE